MEQILKVHSKRGREDNLILKIMDISYIDQMMELQALVVEGIDNEELYVASERQEFIGCIKENGVAIGAVTEDNELVALGTYIDKGYDEKNYGYDIGLKGEEVLKVGQIEATIVHPDFRGNGLQKIMCQALENVGKEKGKEIIAATASPYNTYSVNTFKALGYEVKKDKMKYGGVRRYVLVKKII